MCCRCFFTTNVPFCTYCCWGQSAALTSCLLIQKLLSLCPAWEGPAPVARELGKQVLSTFREKEELMPLPLCKLDFLQTQPKVLKLSSSSKQPARATPGRWHSHCWSFSLCPRPGHRASLSTAVSSSSVQHRGQLLRRSAPRSAPRARTRAACRGLWEVTVSRSAPSLTFSQTNAVISLNNSHLRYFQIAFLPT